MDLNIERLRKLRPPECDALGLTVRDERILRMRWGIGMTLQQIGDQFGLTRERIRQIEAKLLRKLKHPSRSHKLRSFLDR